MPLDDGEALTALAETLSVEIRQPTCTESDGRAYSVLIAGHDRTWVHPRPHRGGRRVRRLRVAGRAPCAGRAAAPGGRPLGAPGGPAGVVMAGRDIGTVVLPAAPRKIYLDASAAERARRRYRETVAPGEPADYEAHPGRHNAPRLHRQPSRHIPPLAAPDAVRVLTDGLTVDEVLAAALRVVQTGAV